LFVENELVIELKTVEELHKKHYAQVRSYLKAVRKQIGLLVNFADFQLDARKVELNK
jgi:GxxExxY protein